MKYSKYLLSALLAFSALPSFSQDLGDQGGVKLVPAAKLAHPEQSALLAASMAGTRVVAVGELGVIVLSDDDGKTFRQAKSVPISFTLTTVTFVDAKHGWAAGHGGAILATSDAGETWTVQRIDTQTDQPLFSIYFKSPETGYAVGLWSLYLKTEDGGKTWNQVSLPPSPGRSKADRNLYQLFGSGESLYLASEQGSVIQSNDQGQNWKYLDTGYAGSWWAGTASNDNSILVGGMRGNLYRSSDHGATWGHIDTGSKKSITGFLVDGNKIFAHGLDGLLICSSDNGKTFRQVDTSIKGAFTAAAQSKRSIMLFSKSGYLGSVRNDCGDNH